MTPSRVGYLMDEMDEMKRMRRRIGNYVAPDSEKACAAAHLCEIWEELYQLQQTDSELAAIDPSKVAEQNNVAA